MSDENVIANQCATCRQFWVGQHVCSLPPLKGNKEVSDEIKLGELEFEAADFDGLTESCSCHYRDPCPHDPITFALATVISEYANRILREKLAKAPITFGHVDAEGWCAWEVPGIEDTHTALLVCIKEIER